MDIERNRDIVSKMEVTSCPPHDVTHEKPRAEIEEADSANEIASTVSRKVADSVGSFAVLKESVQQLLTRLRVAAIPPPPDTSPSVTRLSPRLDDAAPSPLITSVAWQRPSTQRKTAEVRPNQHRRPTGRSPTGNSPDTEDKENVISDWPRPLAGAREEQPTPWWSSEESSGEWDSDQGSPRFSPVRSGDSSGAGGSAAAYLRRLVDGGGWSARSRVPDDAPFRSHSSTSGRSSGGRARRCLFKSKRRISHRSCHVNRSIEVSERDSGGDSETSSATKKGKWSSGSGAERLVEKVAMVVARRRPSIRSCSSNTDQDAHRRHLSDREAGQAEVDLTSGSSWAGGSPGAASVAAVATSVSMLAIASPGAKSLPKAETSCVYQEGNVLRSPASKFRARDVLMGKGQLKLALYINSGLLTVFVKKAKKVMSRKTPLCNSYIKVEMYPRTPGTCSCRTMPVTRNNCPVFNQKFSFEVSPEDENKRLFISVWHRDVTKRNSEFLGCMSFGVSHVMRNQVDGWYRILTERVGKTKHFAVQTRSLTSILKKVRRLPSVELAHSIHHTQSASHVHSTKRAVEGATDPTPTTAHVPLHPAAGVSLHSTRSTGNLQTSTQHGVVHGRVLAERVPVSQASSSPNAIRVQALIEVCSRPQQMRHLAPVADHNHHHHQRVDF